MPWLAYIDWKRRLLRTYMIGWTLLAVAMCVLLVVDMVVGVGDPRLRTFLSLAFAVAGVGPALLLFGVVKIAIPIGRWLAVGPDAVPDRTVPRR